MRTPCLITLLALLIPVRPGAVFAQEAAPPVRFFGDLRVRAEADGRDFNLSSPPNTFTLLRTRVGLEAFPSPDIRVLVMVRDSRVFGAETDAAGLFNTLSDGKNLDLHQGYVEARKFLSDRLMIRLGRQELGYANERMIGTVGWNNVGRVFDGGLLRVEFDGTTADLFAMTVAEVQQYQAAATPASTVPVKDDGQNFFGLYTQRKYAGAHRIDAYLLYQGNRLQTSGGFIGFRRATAGLYAKGTLDGFVYEADASYQTGERGPSDISAYLIAGLAGWAFTGSALTQAAAGYEYLSGTPAGDPGFKTFDPPFATGHKFHGFMDYFTNMPLHTAGLGLADLLARADFRASGEFTAGVWYHLFRAAESAGGEDLFGHEVDLTMKYQYAPALAFEAGISAFLPGPLMRERFGGADTGIWGYLATAVTF